jgi:hypothetical protein
LQYAGEQRGFHRDFHSRNPWLKECFIKVILIKDKNHNKGLFKCQKKCQIAVLFMDKL